MQIPGERRIKAQLALGAVALAVLTLVQFCRNASAEEPCWWCDGANTFVCDKCSDCSCSGGASECASCRGRGGAPAASIPCEQCKGVGKLNPGKPNARDCRACVGGRTVSAPTTCEICGGAGRIDCPSCDGTPCSACAGTRRVHCLHPAPPSWFALTPDEEADAKKLARETMEAKDPRAAQFHGPDSPITQIFVKHARADVRAMKRCALVVKREIADPDVRERCFKFLYLTYGRLAATSAITDETLTGIAHHFVKRQE